MVRYGNSDPVTLTPQVIHARSGGQYEIMGVMYGRVRDHAFWITDAAALPVQGTETRVNAGNEVRSTHARSKQILTL